MHIHLIQRTITDSMAIGDTWTMMMMAVSSGQTNPLADIPQHVRENGRRCTGPAMCGHVF